MDSNFIVGTHQLYDRYYDDWNLQYRSYLGGTEFRNGQYLRQYSSDTQTPSETINTYTLDSDGAYVLNQRARVERPKSQRDTLTATDSTSGTFYGEKLANVPLYNYVKLIVSEYNAMLFRNPPQRRLPDTDQYNDFVMNVDGEGTNISEFMSQVDQYTSIYGVCHVGVYLFNSEVRWKIHSPLDLTNWEYSYDRDGNLRLDRAVVKLDECEEYTMYRYMDSDTIATVWYGGDEEWEPEDVEGYYQLSDGVWMIPEVNELGYVPLVTCYQSLKVYNNVGTTPIADCSQIQRSVYGDLAEIYSAITYSSHPTLIIDESTDQLNNGEIGAEPGSIVRVPTSLTGEQTFTYEFVSPELDAITEIRDLIDNKVDKLTQLAMLRSEDLVRSSRSGEQIEVYDDKLAALIRRKATNMENAEYHMWEITMDWLNAPMPDDFRISYNRQFNKRALEHEIAELTKILDLQAKLTAITGQQPDPVLTENLQLRMSELLLSTSTDSGV